MLQLTKTRNLKLNEWCSVINTFKPEYALYNIKTDCHDYNVENMLYYFKTQPQLASLITCYPNMFQLEKSQILNSSDNLTFIADLHGYIPSQFKALFIQEEKKQWTRQFQTTKSILLTKDYLGYLQKKFNFQITFINSIFFYKNCNLLNQVFKTIVSDRMNPDITPGKKQLLKNIVNYSAGFFGFNQNKPSTVCNKIVPKISWRFNPSKNRISLLGSVDNTDYFVKSTYKELDLTKKQKSCSSPLPLYVSIVEFGKMRMTQILHLLDYFIDSLNVRHLYTNIDNIIIALAQPTLEDSIKPELKEQFLAIQQNYFTPNKPGHFKQEYYFTLDQCWKFVSPLMQNYAIITENNTQSVHKNSSLNYLSSQQSYDYSLKLLNREPINITQTRRVNKAINMDVHDQVFTFK